MRYFTVESPDYERVGAEVWFQDAASAERAGFLRWDAPGSFTVTDNVGGTVIRDEDTTVIRDEDTTVIRDEDTTATTKFASVVGGTRKPVRTEQARRAPVRVASSGRVDDQGQRGLDALPHPASPAYDATIAEVSFAARPPPRRLVQEVQVITAIKPSRRASHSRRYRPERDGYRGPGSRSSRRAPPSGLASKEAVPPCNSACCATSARPRPEPECDAVDPRAKRSNTTVALLLGDADAVVVDRDLHARARTDRRQLHPGGAAVLDGVGDRVVDRQPQPCGQPDDDHRRCGHQRHVQVGVDAHRVVRGAVEQFGDVDGHVVVGRWTTRPAQAVPAPTGWPRCGTASG